MAVPLKSTSGVLEQFAAADVVSADGIIPRSGTTLTLGDAGTTGINLVQGAVQVSALAGTVDPSTGAGVEADAGSTYARQNGGVGELWLKVGAADTAWSQFDLVSVPARSGTATLDFGLSSKFVTSVAVTGQDDILPTDHVQAFFMLDATASHDTYEHMMAAMTIALPCSIPVAGVGFTIFGVTMTTMTGEFLVHWTWTRA